MGVPEGGSGGRRWFPVGTRGTRVQSGVQQEAPLLIAKVGSAARFCNAITHYTTDNNTATDMVNSSSSNTMQLNPDRDPVSNASCILLIRAPHHVALLIP